MQTYLECYPCFLRQALSAARRAGAPEETQYRVLRETMSHLSSGFSLTQSPPEMAEIIHRTARQLSGHADPYHADKARATAEALELLPRLRALIQTAPDPLDAGARVAITGNIIDFGIFEDFDLPATLDRVMGQEFAIGHIETLRKALAQTDHLLYLSDNAGETVFDRAFIESLPGNRAYTVTYAVKGGPVINDALREDAIAAGIDQVAEIIDNGNDAVGTLLERCSTQFQQRFEQAALIIAKGQANYESLSDCQAPILFLLQAKCPVIARHLRVPTGSIIAQASSVLAAKMSDDAQQLPDHSPNRCSS